MTQAYHVLRDLCAFCAKSRVSAQRRLTLVRKDDTIAIMSAGARSKDDSAARLRVEMRSARVSQSPAPQNAPALPDIRTLTDAEAPGPPAAVTEKARGRRTQTAILYDRDDKYSRQNSPVVDDDKTKHLFYYRIRAALPAGGAAPDRLGGSARPLRSAFLTTCFFSWQTAQKKRGPGYAARAGAKKGERPSETDSRSPIQSRIRSAARDFTPILSRAAQNATHAPHCSLDRRACQRSLAPFVRLSRTLQEQA